MLKRAIVERAQKPRRIAHALMNGSVIEKHCGRDVFIPMRI